MDRLTSLLAFARTAETSSFVEAGRRLGLSPSAVGKSVSRLEGALGVRLLHRSTRRLALTVEGEAFFERCRRILDDLDDAEAMIAHGRAAPRGRLRVSLPTIGYRFLLPHLPIFAKLHPEVDLDFDFNDRIVDIVGEGLDVVIRSGVLPNSQLMSRKLGPFRFVLVAAPTYVATCGVPKSANELANHRCLRFRFPTSGRLQDWAIRGAAPDTLRRCPTALVCNNMEALLGAALAGLGIAYMPDFLAAEDMAQGRLVALLDGDLDEAGQFWLLWPAGRQLSPKVRAFIEFSGQSLFRTGRDV